MVTMAATILPVQAQSQPGGNDPQDSRLQRRLREATGGAGRLSRHAGTGRIRFFGTTPDRPVRRTTFGAPAGASPEGTAREFLETYGPLFGIEQAGDLGPGRTVTRDRGRAAVRFQQTHKGVPVLAGELNVNLDQAKNVLAVSGEARPGLNLDVGPGIGAGRARQQAMEAISKQRKVAAAELQATDPSLWIYDPALLGGAGGPPTAVWRLEVTSTGAEHMRELVLVQAQSGNVLLHFDQEAHAKNRFVCDRNNTRTASHACSSPYTRTEGGPATGIADVDLAYDYTGVTYDYFGNNFGRDSLDDAGMPLVSTVRYCSSSGACPYANAFWDGSQMTYGQGFATDDIVGHELTHGVTEFSAGLLYYYQSGAINESMSDVFGELIDLTDGRGNDSPGVRWQIGEDLTGGAFRNMANPPAYSDPDAMTSAYYFSGWQDQGGVHSNSGVNNKAASLMVDGGSLNGVTVSPLGTNKVGHVYYEALTGLMTSASDYQDLYDILPQACFSLVGTNGITAADCAQVRNAVEATQMNRQPTAGAATVEAPLCSAGETPTDLFFDNLENPASGNWVKTTAAGYGWAYPQNPNAYSNFDATYATSGKTNMFGDDPDSLASYSIARSAGVVPPPAGSTYLRFNHSYGFEPLYDGGVVEYSTDGGATWVDADPLFVDGGYDTQLNAGTGHPLSGRRAFNGDSFGYGSSRINLSPLAGRSVRFRFTIGADSVQGDYGWFIDDVRVYNCKTSQPPALAVNDVSVVEGNSGSAAATFAITRSGDTSGTSTVKYATATTGTATSGSDYTAVSLTAVSFAPGETTKAVTVNVTGDVVSEANEVFYLSLSAATGATISDKTGVGTIVNDEAPVTLAVNDVSVVEGNSGPAAATFTITRSGDTSGTSTVKYATATTGTATSGSDYTAAPLTAVSFAPGETTKAVTVNVTGDVVDEANEYFYLSLSAATGATISDSTGMAWIVDDEGPVTPGPSTFLSVNDVSVVEGNSGSAAATFTITRSGDTSGTSAVKYATATTGTATSGVDYTAAPLTAVSFAPGETTKAVTVNVTGDVVSEANEIFYLSLSAATGATISDSTGLGTIVNDEAPVTLAVNNVNVVEGNSGPAAATFTITRSGATSGTSAVKYATATTGTATSGSDYTALPLTAVSFAPGETTKAVTVNVIGDVVAEANEYFYLSLSAATGATISDSTGIGTIVNDD